MQGYEIVTIVDPQIADEDVPKTSEKINEFITSRGGAIARVQRWGRRRLAYPIKRQMEAHYVLTTYELDPEHASELEADLVLAQEVLKHMVVKLDDETFQKASEEPPAPVVVETPAESADSSESAMAEASAPEAAVTETTEPATEEPAPEPTVEETAAEASSSAAVEATESEEEGEGAGGESGDTTMESKEGT